MVIVGPLSRFVFCFFCLLLVDFPLDAQGTGVVVEELAASRTFNWINHDLCRVGGGKERKARTTKFCSVEGAEFYTGPCGLTPC